MSTISGQYATVPLYSLYQAGQGSSASGQTSLTSPAPGQNPAQNNAVSERAPQSGANQGGAQPSGNQNDLAALQASLGNGASPAAVAAPAPPPTTYTHSTADDSSGSFINNQQAIADYQSMVLNLGQGNIAAAAKDYAQLQTDFKLHGQHHAGGTVAVDMNSSVDSSAGSVLNVTV